MIFNPLSLSPSVLCSHWNKQKYFFRLKLRVAAGLDLLALGLALYKMYYYDVIIYIIIIRPYKKCAPGVQIITQLRPVTGFWRERGAVRGVQTALPVTNAKTYSIQS